MIGEHRCGLILRLILATLLLAGGSLLIPGWGAENAFCDESGEKMSEYQVLETPSGVRFGLLGQPGMAPLPTVFVFAMTMQGFLEQPDVTEGANRGIERVTADLLLAHGCLCVSLDLPYHGELEVPTRPIRLKGWVYAVKHGENFITDFQERCSAVLDFLVEQGYTDPERVAAVGSSRAGYAAFWLAAADARIKWVASCMPLIDPRHPEEFAALREDPLLQSLNLLNAAASLADRGIWITIGNNDQRAGTDYAIRFAREVTRYALEQGYFPNVELHVTSIQGHQVHATAPTKAAQWLLTQLDANE